MAFSQASIQDVTLTGDTSRGVLFVSWQASDPITSGTLYQVYLDQRLVWYGTARQCDLPYPGGVLAVRVDVGTVGGGQGSTDYSSSLAADPGTGNKPSLSWVGGPFLDPGGNGDVSGYYIYEVDTAAAHPLNNAIIATVPLYSGGISLGGFGFGGFGAGTFGTAATTYTWTGPRLPNASPSGFGMGGFGMGGFAKSYVTFAVAPFDAAGNVGTQSVSSPFIIAAAPQPPAPNSAGKRLTYSYNPTSHVVTLNWLASPG